MQSFARRYWLLLLLIPYLVLFLWDLDSMRYFHMDERVWVRVGFVEFERYFVNRNYEHEAWQGILKSTFTSNFNPPAAKYIMGASLWLHGYRDLKPLPAWQTGKSVEWHVQQGLLPPAEELRAARLPIAILAACTALLVALIALELSGSTIAGAIASLLVVLNPNFALHAHRAMVDIPALFFSVLVVYAVLRAFRSARRDILWIGIASLSLALAISSKLNTLLVYAVLGAAALWLGWRTWRSVHLGRSILILLLAGLVPPTVFFALNPYLWHNTARGLRSLYRLSEIVAGYRPNFPKAALYTWGDKLLAFAKYAFPPFTSLVSLSDFIHIVLFLAGAAFAVRAVFRSENRLLSGAVLLWALVTCIGTIAWSPLSWDRYYLPWVPIAALLEGLGAYWLFASVKSFVSSKRPSPAASP